MEKKDLNFLLGMLTNFGFKPSTIVKKLGSELKLWRNPDKKLRNWLIFLTKRKTRPLRWRLSFKNKKVAQIVSKLKRIGQECRFHNWEKKLIRIVKKMELFDAKTILLIRNVSRLRVISVVFWEKREASTKVFQEFRTKIPNLTVESLNCPPWSTLMRARSLIRKKTVKSFFSLLQAKNFRKRRLRMKLKRKSSNSQQRRRSGDFFGISGNRRSRRLQDWILISVKLALR